MRAINKKFGPKSASRDKFIRFRKIFNNMMIYLRYILVYYTDWFKNNILRKLRTCTVHTCVIIIIQRDVMTLFNSIVRNGNPDVESNTMTITLIND